jgi:hypothetical protein
MLNLRIVCPRLWHPETLVSTLLQYLHCSGPSSTFIPYCGTSLYYHWAWFCAAPLEITPIMTDDRFPIAPESLKATCLLRVFIHLLDDLMQVKGGLPTASRFGSFHAAGWEDWPRSAVQTYRPLQGPKLQEPTATGERSQRDLGCCCFTTTTHQRFFDFAKHCRTIRNIMKLQRWRSRHELYEAYCDWHIQGRKMRACKSCKTQRICLLHGHISIITYVHFQSWTMYDTSGYVNPQAKTSPRSVPRTCIH